MRGIILYRTYHGSTRQYAEYIAGATGFPIYNIDTNELPSLDNCDFLILGSPVYMGSFSIAPWVKRNQEHLKGKKIILFSVTGFSNDHNGIERVYQQNFSEELRNSITHFHLHGRLSQSGLSRWEQFVINLESFFNNHETCKDKSEQCKMAEEIVSHIKNLSLEMDYK